MSKIQPTAYHALMGLEKYLETTQLTKQQKDLIKIRASQINGCAFCLEMHTREARALGETEERIHLLGGWRESPLYDARERAALAWAESLTLIADTHAPDDVYDAARQQFNERELTELTVAVGLINLWNRVQAGFRAIHPEKNQAA